MADPRAELAKALGLDLDATGLLGNVRSKRCVLELCLTLNTQMVRTVIVLRGALKDSVYIDEVVTCNKIVKMEADAQGVVRRVWEALLLPAESMILTVEVYLALCNKTAQRSRDENCLY